MSIFNKVYKKNKAIQSRSVNPLVEKALKYLIPKSKGIDLGCGQGQNTFYLASKNFNMTAIDSSNIAVEQIKNRFLKKEIKNIKVRQVDISDYSMRPNYYNFVICLNVLQFLERKNILILIDEIKNKINKNGIVVISSFTDKDLSYKIRKRSIKYHFKQGELKNIFKDFEILYYSENIVIDKGHVGNKKIHKHGLVSLIARKEI